MEADSEHMRLEEDAELVREGPQYIRKDGKRYEGPYMILQFMSTHQVILDFCGKPKPRHCIAEEDV